MTPVRTRFAPSPTGYMHIGGMRTALFCWLFARHHGGTFILRIDDTDQQRNMDEALGPILRAFTWLGLHWDEGPTPDGKGEIGAHGPYFQSRRGESYKAAASKLLEDGRAYRDFDAPEQAKADREAAEKEKRTYLTPRRSLELSAEEVARFVQEGRPHVVRFLVPRDRKITLHDAVRGAVEWDCGLINDPVIVRGDGSPLYNFATVVDDAEMRITHVIRSEEHLTNTAVQLLIHEALGNTLPVFGHIPYVAAPGSKEKLSKRKLDKYRKNPQFGPMFEKAEKVFPRIGLEGAKGLDPVMVEYYEQLGYLPAGVLNALVRIGWSLDDKAEIFSLEDMVKHFTLDRVVKSPASLDPDKFTSFEAHWMGQTSLAERTEGCLAFLKKAGIVKTGVDKPPEAFVEKLITVLGDRIKLFSDILDYDEYFIADDAFAYDEKAFEKRMKEPGAVDLLRSFRRGLASAEPFEPAALEKLLHDVTANAGAKPAALIHPLRLAITGKATGPGLYDCLLLLGRERALARIDRTLGKIGG